jgi:Protein of unknown function (DUF1367)
MKRRGASLLPCSELDEQDLLEFPESKELMVTLTRPRSSRQHRFFWALLQKVCENSEGYQKPEQLLVWLKVKLGYVKEVKFHDGDVWWETQSISFNSMGQDEFRKFFDAAIDCIISDVIPGLGRDNLLHEVSQMVGFTHHEI